jgi:adenine/guanine phosphoribosyltransferase-like PRPP-binding protein
MPAGDTQEFTPGRRGSRLGGYLQDAAPDGSSHRLYLRASREIACQFQVIYQNMPGSSMVEQADGNWTHRLEASGPCPAEAVTLADLLTDVITLPKVPGLDFAIAMDWYKKRLSDVDPWDWQNTLGGRLVHMVKYGSGTALQKDAAGAMLSRRLQKVARQHPVMAAADVVVAVPGHDRSTLSTGERLAASVAQGLGRPLTRVSTKHEFRPPAKDMPSGVKRVMHQEFEVTQDLSGTTALVVDDVFRTGGTISATAMAVVKAGAGYVCGLVAVRTARGQ